LFLDQDHIVLKKKLRKKKSGARNPDYEGSGDERVKKVKERAELLCSAEGMEMVHAEYRHEPGGRVLRVYIDKAGGVNLDDCAIISRQLSDLLDVNFEGSMEYNLEVSSPGPNRPLNHQGDFERFRGEIVKVQTLNPMNGQKNFKGILSGVDEGNIELLINGETVTLPLVEISRARLAGGELPT